MRRDLHCRQGRRAGSWYIVYLYGVTMWVEQRLLGSLTGGQGSRPRDDAAAAVVNGKSLPISSMGEMKESRMGGAVRGRTEKKIHSPGGLRKPSLSTLHLVEHSRVHARFCLPAPWRSSQSRKNPSRCDQMHWIGSFGPAFKAETGGRRQGGDNQGMPGQLPRLCRGDTNHGLGAGLAG